MNAPKTQHREPRILLRGIGLHGRVAVLGSMAGGIALGGVFLAAMTLMGRLSAHALFLDATTLFLIGAFAGGVHGIVLGLLGRPEGLSLRSAVPDMGRAMLYTIPALAVAWLIAVWVAMTVPASYLGRPGPLVGVTAGWMAAVLVMGVAAVHTWKAVGNAFARWPERRVGTALVAGTVVALSLIFLADRPEIWGVRLRISETAAILLAAILAVWVVGPSVTLALRLLDRLPFPGVGVGLVRPGWKGGDVVVGAVTGLVVALMAVPFVGPGVSHPGAGAVVVEVAQALVDEVLLRLVLVTGVAWLFLRWHRVQGGEAAVVAVLVATASQVALYTPGALAVGFPDWTGTVAFLLAGVAVPAVAFGVLFWKKGFGAALAADATALLALLLIT